MNSRDNTDPGDRRVARMDPEIAEIVPIFLEQMFQDLASLKEAVDRGDYGTIRILGHSMNGSGGGFGFDVITDLGWSLEQAAVEQNPQKIRQLSGELASYLERVSPNDEQAT